MISTLHTATMPNGVPCLVPNRVTRQEKNWHISYNNYDRAIYGCDTTALVVNNWDFYILNGDHCEKFNECLTLEDAKEYFFQFQKNTITEVFTLKK